MALEFVRQVHYFIEERSKGYYRFWQQKVFGGMERGLGKMNDYTRYRAGRAFKFVLFLLVLSTLLGRIFDTDPVWLGIVEAPARLVGALPFVIQLAFGFFFVMFQFIGLFWFLSRGGIDTIMPDEIETRFDDVKGQDAALGQLKETLVFLDDPEAIESRGGYVPGGILLWGPPGTGKTLMAQAVAGEIGEAFRERRRRRLHQHVHGRRHPQGAFALPQAPEAVDALWRRDRVHRRGGLPRQPRISRSRTGFAPSAHTVDDLARAATVGLPVARGPPRHVPWRPGTGVGRARGATRTPS